MGKNYVGSGNGFIRHETDETEFQGMHQGGGNRNMGGVKSGNLRRETENLREPKKANIGNKKDSSLNFGMKCGNLRFWNL